MTTFDQTRPMDTSEEPVDNYLTYTRGIKSWLLTLDHKRIGVMYMVSVLSAFFVGGIFGLLVRTELLTPGPGPIPGVDANMYNQFFTLHGAIMVFLVIIPSIPAVFGNFVLPIMLGAKDVAFPRLNLFSYYLWVSGALLAVISLVAGGFDTGWTFYTPYSTRTSAGGVIFVVSGVFLLGFSSIFTGMNFIVTTHKLRPPGMTWFRMPLFLWAIYATALIQVLATPVLAITLLMLIVERLLGVGFFDPAMGGDPVLFQHFFWFYSHPAVYIMILPGMGIISDLIAVHSPPTHLRVPLHCLQFDRDRGVLIPGLGTPHVHLGPEPADEHVLLRDHVLGCDPLGDQGLQLVGDSVQGIDNPEHARCSTGLGFIFLFTIGGLTGLHLGTLNT